MTTRSWHEITDDFRKHLNTKNNINLNKINDLCVESRSKEQINMILDMLINMIFEPSCDQLKIYICVKQIVKDNKSEYLYPVQLYLVRTNPLVINYFNILNYLAKKNLLGKTTRGINSQSIISLLIYTIPSSADSYIYGIIQKIIIRLIQNNLICESKEVRSFYKTINDVSLPERMVIILFEFIKWITRTADTIKLEYAYIDFIDFVCSKNIKYRYDEMLIMFLDRMEADKEPTFNDYIKKYLEKRSPDDTQLQIIVNYYVERNFDKLRMEFLPVFKPSLTNHYKTLELYLAKDAENRELMGSPLPGKIFMDELYAEFSELDVADRDQKFAEEFAKRYIAERKNRI